MSRYAVDDRIEKPLELADPIKQAEADRKARLAHEQDIAAGRVPPDKTPKEIARLMIEAQFPERFQQPSPARALKTILAGIASVAVGAIALALQERSRKQR